MVRTAKREASRTQWARQNARTPQTGAPTDGCVPVSTPAGPHSVSTAHAPDGGPVFKSDAGWVVYTGEKGVVATPGVHPRR